ncbi:MAG: hypothetical protein IIZ90_02400, partial [Bacteroidales bacterium]|nr:hypothetical protein [Bacteroidales bacterium]
IAHDSELTLRNSLFSNALNDCMALYGCTAEVDACTLAQFYAFSANRGAALRFAPSDNYPLALSPAEFALPSSKSGSQTGLQESHKATVCLFCSRKQTSPSSA